MPKTVFLDRDGLINKKAAPHEYITDCSMFELLPGVADAIALLNAAAYQVIVITNQRGIARGKMTTDDLKSIHACMSMELAEHKAHVDAIYVCPHDEGQCHCRKPDIGLFLQAEKDFEIDKSCSWMVGDSETDVQAGNNYGVRTIMTDSLMAAVKEILG